MKVLIYSVEPHLAILALGYLHEHGYEARLAADIHEVKFQTEVWHPDITVHDPLTVEKLALMVPD